MNNRISGFIKNFSYTLTSNLISMVVSTLVVLIIPKVIGVEEYGYWQLYIFYSSYVGFLHFGWNDGIYLRYGGKEYNELDKTKFFSQFYMLVIFQLLIAIIILTGANLLVVDISRRFIFQMIAICLLIANVRCMLVFILQATNRIKEYAKITMMDRIFYCLLIIVFLLVGIREYKLIIMADLIGKSLSLLYAIYCCKDIVVRKFSTFYFSVKETIENLNVGIKLMFANIASTMIIGVVRFGVERSWDVRTFGKVSLTLSVSNLMMIFINAVGIIMFPALRRTVRKKLPSIYATMRTFLMVILLGMLIVYYPMRVILSRWLPQYADSLMYMALVFPMCVYEGKMSLLINTYLKTLRKEKMILKINLTSLIASIIITCITVLVLKNLNLAVVSIVILLAFRCILAEIFLSKSLDISIYKDIVLEVILTIIFISVGWFINSWIAVVFYAISYGIYLLIKRKDINNTIKGIKLIMKV